MITGRVQGVGFRYFTEREARRLDLDGWVRNTDDGAVEVEVQGEQSIIDEFLTRISAGPRNAVVTSVTKQEVPLMQESGFIIRENA
jgi:acylphosphatase